MPLVVLLLLVATGLHAQSINTRMGARASGMAYASFALIDDHSIFNNVAALAWGTATTAGFAYDLSPTLPGGDRASASLLIPVGDGSLGAGVFRFGDDTYSEQLISAGYAHRIATTSLGIKANIVQYRAGGFETRHAVTVDFGGLMKITPEWTVAAGLFNLSQAALIEGELLPVVFVAALSWSQVKGPLLAVEFEKHLGLPLRIKLGAEIPLYKKLFLRTGFGQNPISASGGIGARMHKLSLDFSTTYNQAFGLSYQASAGYRITKSSTR